MSTHALGEAFFFSLLLDLFSPDFLTVDILAVDSPSPEEEEVGLHNHYTEQRSRKGRTVVHPKHGHAIKIVHFC